MQLTMKDAQVESFKPKVESALKDESVNGDNSTKSLENTTTSTSKVNVFHTPPISNSKFDLLKSVNTSYKTSDQISQVSVKSSATTNSIGATSTTSSSTMSSSTTANTSNSNMHVGNESLINEEDVEKEVNVLKELPPELMKILDLFIVDLKQPKYAKPLTILQLSSVFQNFYTSFDKNCFQYLQNIQLQNNSSNSNVSTYMNARETLSSGLSGLFARSRSSSVNSNVPIRGRRSSSLFSSDSTTNVTQMLSPEEINKQLKNNELNNLKIEKYMEFCEKDIFKKIIDVGTSAIKPNEMLKSTSINETDELPTKKNNTEKNTELFKLSQLFKNSPEYEKYSNLLHKKIKCLNKLNADNTIDLKKFLEVPSNFQEEDFIVAEKIFNELIYNSIAPCEKLGLLVKLHRSMTSSTEPTSNDEYLSLLIYYVIRANPKNIFLNTQFIKLFRYKKKLVENELFVLTNIEATLTFIDSIKTTDFSKETQEILKRETQEILDISIGKVVKLPSLHHSLSSSNLDQIVELPLSDNINRSASYDGIKTVLDASVKNILGRIKPYAYGKPISRSPSLTSLDNTATVKFSGKENEQFPTGIDETLIGDNSTPEVEKLSLKTPTINNWKKYRDLNFEDLKVNELKEIFEVYKTFANKNSPEI
ncbi:hypothetical protein TPHA_0L01640 [Tetrapisispora phaffii CBS 4417]|uniref:VPS9 domain-containing protein n=1 Tax=Tetrapisispora phaffii (strain ATCC 24235 / CBS 4417 / NBRC 1672 / NRRL Y-8282 / UCD 70-5) TaxID=1071381 RepID=G8C039_TETPH|nr:hypothetical protein TPHA_0L01640 [Tetrapisispora phaffii CBS 4417]CCE65517.1 hypothetical protein TPHA_0L01640 [Tetrapisispora phaffii CBS 4417]